MFAHHYQAPRERLPCAPADLPHVLNVLKERYPYRFWQQLCVTPYTFDRLVTTVQDDPIFANNSNCPQIPVENQVAIVLYQFGRFGNGVSLLDVANWAGVGEGTVSLITERVLTALLCPALMKLAVDMPVILFCKGNLQYRVGRC